MSAGKPQIRVALGTVEVTDTDRRAITWYTIGRPALAAGESTNAILASRETTRTFLMEHGERGLEHAVSEFFAAGGQSASMEGGQQR